MNKLKRGMLMLKYLILMSEAFLDINKALRLYIDSSITVPIYYYNLFPC